MSGVQILSVTNMKLQVVRLGTVRIYFLKKKRILNIAHCAGGWSMYKNKSFQYFYILNNGLFLKNIMSFYKPIIYR